MPALPPPLDAFATYLGRRLAEEHRPPPAVLEASAAGTLEASARVPAGTEIALVRVPDGPAAGELAPIEAGALGRLEAASGLSVRFAGPGYVLLDGFDPLAVGSPPAEYPVLAIVTTFNEADIVGGLLDRLLDDGIAVHVIDNWSTDGTAELVAERAGSERAGTGRVGSGQCRMERYPAAGPSPYFELSALLRRVEQVAQESGAKWVIHHDCDEIRQPPWSGVGLRQALYAVEQFGFNCVDHTVVNFLPVDDEFRPGDDLERHFGFFEFGDVSAHFQEQKAWMPQDEPVEIASTGGHEAAFSGRRVFPYKFLLRHYPIRSQSHGERKIFRERQGRFHPGERARGWHIHYDVHLPGSSFLRDPAGLLAAEDLDGAALLQRLSGAGLPGNPNPGEGPTPRDPRQLRIVLGAGEDDPAATVRVELAIAPLPPGTLARSLGSIGRATAAFRQGRAGATVDLALVDHSTVPALPAHQLDAIAASLQQHGMRAVCYEHVGHAPGAPRADGADGGERLRSSVGPPSEVVVLTDGWCHLSPGLLAALASALDEGTGVVFARRLPVEVDVEGDPATGEHFPRRDAAPLGGGCVLVRTEVLDRLDRGGRSGASVPSAVGDLVAAAHDAGYRVAYAPEATYVRDEPVAALVLGTAG